MGPQTALRMIDGLPECEAYLLRKDLGILQSDGWSAATGQLA